MVVNMKTRQKSATEGRRNSVSDIAEYFKSRAESQNSPMGDKKKSQSKNKDKDKEKELKEVRENIKRLIDQDGQQKDEGVIANANGGGSDSPLNGNHDNVEQDQREQINNQEETTNDTELLCESQTTIATQTNDDEMLKAIRELA